METGLLLPSSYLFAQNSGHKTITLELISLLAQKPETEVMLKNSLENAKSINSGIVTRPAQDLESYCTFIDSASEPIPRQIPDVPAVFIRDQILQSFCYFYFLIDQPLTELEKKGFCKNAIQYYPPFSQWLKKFADQWGDFLDTEKSWNPKTFRQFYDDPQFSLQAEWYESPDNWKTFNQFFSKYLRTLFERPISYLNDPSVVVSPTDPEPQGVWPIDENSTINSGKGLTVKLARYHNVNDLLAEDSNYTNVLTNGPLTHTCLNVFDYHRYHFAVVATGKEQKIIQKNVALKMTWSDEKGEYIPIDSEGWQFTQTRGYVIADTGEFGLVALIPMGMKCGVMKGEK